MVRHSNYIYTKYQSKPTYAEIIINLNCIIVSELSRAQKKFAAHVLRRDKTYTVDLEVIAIYKRKSYIKEKFKVYCSD